MSRTSGSRSGPAELLDCLDYIHGQVCVTVTLSSALNMCIDLQVTTSSIAKKENLWESSTSLWYREG